MKPDEKIEVLERLNAKLRGEVKLLSERVTTLQQGLIQGTIRSAAKDAGIHESALDDVLLRASLFEVAADGAAIVTKEGVGVTPGLSAKDWLTEMQPKKPHWWPDTAGGGAPGSKGGTAFPNNPWTSEYWNKTQQAQIINADEKKAEQMARAAGVDVFALRPRAK